MTTRITPGIEGALPPDALAGAPAADPLATDGAAAAPSLPPVDGDGPAAGGDWRPADFAAVQECLTLVARAIRQFHTYPETSPLCLDAIAAAQKALVGLNGREHLAFRVTPSAVVVDEVDIGTGGVIGHEVAQRLHRAQVAAVEIARTASPRDLTRFCKDLSGFGDSIHAAGSFIDLLLDHGVSQITVRQAHRPQVFDVGVLHEPVRRLVEHEKQRRQALFATGGPVQHLYPPDKGWVRVDPSASQPAFSLVDLAVLIDNPAEVALALMRLTGDEADATHDPRIAFEHKFSDLAMIFSAVDPRLSRLLFSKLSRAVLQLEPDRRSRLLKRTVLPGLLDGKLDGSVLTDFPDVDLAEALCLLLDLETASPDVLTTALDRLGLPSERRAAVVPLLEERLQKTDKARPDAYGHDHAIETYARRLIAMKPGEQRSFAEYTAFDLSVTEQTKATVARLVTAIGATDLQAVQLEARFQLVKLEPNPALVATFMDRTLLLFDELEKRQQWATLAQWAGRFRRLAGSLEATRPDVATAIRSGLEKFCTVPRLLAVAELYKADGKPRALTHAFIDGFGTAGAGAILAALDAGDTSAAARPLISLMTEHAESFAPVLVDHLPTRGAVGRQAILKVLGTAGPAHAAAVIALLAHADEPTGREAMRALAKMGTLPAAAAVAACLHGAAAWARSAAEEALWHFPPAQAAAQVRKLLANREFVMSHPEIAGRLMDRAAQAGATGLAPVLATIAPLRFRFWNPAIVRVAMKARQLLHP